MAKTDITRRQQLVAGLKSAVATAAIVGSIGGWAAFSGAADSNTLTADTATVAVASTGGVASVASLPTATASNTASDTASNTTSIVSAPSSQRSAVTSTRSSR